MKLIVATHTNIEMKGVTDVLGVFATVEEARAAVRAHAKSSKYGDTEALDETFEAAVVAGGLVHYALNQVEHQVEYRIPVDDQDAFTETGQRHIRQHADRELRLVIRRKKPEWQAEAEQILGTDD